MELLVIAILLTVTDAQKPTCGTSCRSDVTVEGDSISFTCEGASGAVLTWHYKLTNEEFPEVPEQNTETSRRDFTLTAVAPGVDALYCLSKIPEAEDEMCETDKCDILYSVTNVVTSPEFYASPGEKITCKADGNPAPSFEWQWTREDGDDNWMDVPDAKTEEIDAELKNGTSIQLRCVAKNTVKGEEKTANSPAVTVSKYGAYIRTAIIVGVVVGVALLGGTAGVIYKVKN